MVFRNIRVPNARLVHLSWLNHHPKETLQAYAARMAEQIKEENPIIMGLSFGGMIAIEIARQFPVKKLIIISGVKTARELPRWMRIAGKWQMHKWLPVRSNILTERYDNRMLGISSPEEKKIVKTYRKALDKKFQSWAINHILTWQNHWYPQNAIHIHGEKDRMFPIKNITATHIIRNGTHLMVYNQAGQVSECLADSIGPGNDLG